MLLQTVRGSLFFLTFAFAAFLRDSHAWDENGVSSDSAIGVIAEGYQRNRESFVAFDCRFRHIATKAKTREDAIAGRFIREGIVRRGHWVVDGPLTRYELLCDPQLVKETEKRMAAALKSPGDVRVSVPCSDVLYLRNKEFSLRYGPLLLVGNLFGQSEVDSSGIRVTPFNVDFLGGDERSNPGRYLKDSLSGRFKGIYLGTERLNGHDVLGVEVTGRLSVIKCAFDPKRGYMLVYQADERKTGKLYEVHVLEAREFSGGRWFPTRVVKLLNPDAGGPISVEFVEVDALSMDVSMPPDMFQLTLAKGTQVSAVGHIEWTNIEETEIIRVDELAELKRRCVAGKERYLAGLERDRTADTSAVAISAPSLTRNALFVGNVLLLLFLGYLIFVRRPKPKTA